MSDVEVATTVTIKDAMGRTVVSLTKSAVQSVTDNPRFWATYTRGSIQHTEHAIANMLIAEYGDKPE